LIISRKTAIQHFRARAFLTAQGGDEDIGVLHDFHTAYNDITGDVSQVKGCFQGARVQLGFND